MLLEDFHHVALIASDYKTSRHFYVDLLGCEVIRETWRAGRDSWKLDLRVGNHSQLELFSFPNPPPRVDQPEARGLRHLAYGVQDVEAVVAQLETKGIEVEAIRIDELTGKRFAFFKDPDGLPLELYETKK